MSLGSTKLETALRLGVEQRLRCGMYLLSCDDVRCVCASKVVIVTFLVRRSVTQDGGLKKEKRCKEAARSQHRVKRFTRRRESNVKTVAKEKPKECATQKIITRNWKKREEFYNRSGGGQGVFCARQSLLRFPFITAIRDLKHGNGTAISYLAETKNVALWPYRCAYLQICASDRQGRIYGRHLKQPARLVSKDSREEGVFPHAKKQGIRLRNPQPMDKKCWDMSKSTVVSILLTKSPTGSDECTPPPLSLSFSFPIKPLPLSNWLISTVHPSARHAIAHLRHPSLPHSLPYTITRLSLPYDARPQRLGAALISLPRRVIFFQ